MPHYPAQELPPDRMGCVEDVLNALHRIIIGGKAADICTAPHNCRTGYVGVRVSSRGPTFEKFTPADLVNEILLGFDVEGVMNKMSNHKYQTQQEQQRDSPRDSVAENSLLNGQYNVNGTALRIDRVDYDFQKTLLQYVRVSRHCSWNRYRKRLEIAKEQMLAAEVELEIAESLVQQQQARVGACQQLPADICHEIFSDVLAAARQDWPWSLNVSVFLAQVCARWRGMFQTTAMAALLNPISLLRTGFEMEGVVKKGLRSAEAIDTRLSYFEGTKTSVDMVIALDDGLPVSALKRVLRSTGSWRRLSITGLHAIGLKERGLRHVLCTSEPSFGELKELFLNGGIPDWRDTADKLPWWASATENLRLLLDDLGLHDYKNLEHVWLPQTLHGGRNDASNATNAMGTSFRLEKSNDNETFWCFLPKLMNNVKPVALSSAGDTAGEAEAIQPQEWAGSNGASRQWGERWREPTQPSAGVVCPRAALKAFIARSRKELERLDLQTRMELDDNAIMELVRPCHYLRTLQFRHRSENILTPTLLEYLADTRNLRELQEVVIPDPGPGEDYSLEEWITGFMKMGLARFGPGGLKW
ncbi:hypothetical protein B0H10DRAFT_1965718 [Mycena sp. CBHHK59/15]|nr:hypothetical protein B0H10DRAFT_1965718 [Mycena sp. CBHHK59/15]